MKTFKWTLAALLSVSGLWFLSCWFVAGQFLDFGIVDYVAEDERTLLDQLGVPERQRQTVEIQSDGVILAGSFFRHPDPRGCAVVLLPGIGGHRTQVLPALPIFRDLGCHVLAYDPRGTGASSRVQRTFGFLEKKDNAAVIGWLEAATHLPPTAIGVWGPSFGAAVGLLTLDEVERLGFVIADSTFHSFSQVVRDTLEQLSGTVAAQVLTAGVIYCLGLRTGLDADALNPEQSIVGTQTPVLLIHAREDPAMYLYHSQKVFAARTTNKVTLEVTDWGAGHADSALVNPQAYRALVHNFLSPLGFTAQPLSGEIPQDR